MIYEDIFQVTDRKIMNRMFVYETYDIYLRKKSEKITGIFDDKVEINF